MSTVVGWHRYSCNDSGRFGRVAQDCSGTARALGCRNNAQHLHARNSRVAACCG